MLVDEFESLKTVLVLAAGQSILPFSDTYDTREVKNGCAICLSEYDCGDQVTWAANEECQHVFHSDCILQWMLAVGRKEQKKRRRYPELATGDPIKDVIDFPMLCPCCRQVFVKPEESFTGALASPTQATSSEDSPTDVQESGSEETTVDGDAAERDASERISDNV